MYIPHLQVAMLVADFAELPAFFRRHPRVQELLRTHRCAAPALAVAADPFSGLGALLHAAVQERNMHGDLGVHTLMCFGPPLDHLDHDRNTPLHKCVLKSFVAGVEALIAYNADISRPDGEFGLEAADLCARVMALKQEGKRFRLVAFEDLTACQQLLTQARQQEYLKNDSASEHPDDRLRVNDLAEVIGMENYHLATRMNGRSLRGPTPSCPATGSGSWSSLTTRGVARPSCPPAACAGRPSGGTP